MNIIAGSRRLRRRGPRSLVSLHKRKIHSNRPLSDEVGGESPIASSGITLQQQSLNILVCNIQCFLSKCTELHYYAQVYDAHLVLVQESWLNEASINIELAGYTMLSNRNRHEGENRGGMLAFCRNDVKNCIHWENSRDAERSWHLI